MAAEWINGNGGKTVAYDLQNGEVFYYQTRKITEKLHLVIMDDWITFKGEKIPTALICELRPSEDVPGYYESAKELMTISWNEESKMLFRNIKKLSALELLTKLHNLQTSGN